jgi:hypothetical protein
MSANGSREVGILVSSSDAPDRDGDARQYRTLFVEHGTREVAPLKLSDRRSGERQQQDEREAQSRR